MVKEYAIATNQAEWHELRKKGLGGSDIGTMLGFNTFKSPYQLWLEKTEQIAADDISDKVAIQVGNELEDLVARIFTQQTGLKVQKDNKTHFHDDYPFLLANIDRKIVGQKALLECKTTGVFNKSQWVDDEIPAPYLMQVQHYLNVLDFDKAYIAVIIGNNDFLWKEIKRDDELIKAYTERAVAFWETNITKKIPPSIDGSKSTSEALNKLYGDAKANEIAMSADQHQQAKSLDDLAKTIKQLTDSKKELENRFKESLGQQDAQIMTGQDYQVAWKPVTSKRIDSKRLKKEQPDLYTNYSNETISKRFSVKEI